jgi:hypothetical protein
MQLYQLVVLDETWVFSKGGNRKSWQDGYDVEKDWR